MSNKSKKKTTAKVSKKKNNLLPIIAAIAVAACMATVFLMNRNETTIADSEADHEVCGAITVASGESLVIPAADITNDASFFPLEVDGVKMEVIAVKDSDGNIRTAFNTCRICYSSEQGYYVQSGNYLICQNCGNRFSMDQIEMETGGCNPWPISSENKTVTDDEIMISYDFLVESQAIFANWKKQ